MTVKYKKQKCNPVQQTLITTTTLIGEQCVQLTSIVRRIRGRDPFLRPHWIIKYIIISEWKREMGTRVER